ncbi:MAG: hypothetical protein K5871_04040 [Lachnospiraceae bacterium]|nr:hypothetical protein [Lachnospiraceae bacterium]
MYKNSIMDWWGTTIVIYLAFYFTSILTIVSSLVQRTASIIFSIIMLFVSATLLGADMLSYLGFAATLNSTPMIKMGIMPVVNIMNVVANGVILIECIPHSWEIRIPFEKLLPAEKRDSALGRFFRIFNILDVVGIALVCACLVYFAGGR